GFDIGRSPSPEPVALVAGQIGGKPASNRRAGECSVGLVAEEQVFRRVARCAMSKSRHDISASIPRSRSGGVGMEGRLVEEHCVPEPHHRADIEWKKQFVLWMCCMHGLERLQICEESVGVRAVDVREIFVRECGIEVSTIGADPVVKGATELRVRPPANTCLSV